MRIGSALLVALLLTSPPPAQAQSVPTEETLQLRLQVLDARDGSPLSRALVRHRLSGIEALTGPDGWIPIRVFPGRTLVLDILKPGYRDAVSVIFPERAVEVAVRLELLGADASRPRLEGVVTAAASGEPLGEVRVSGAPLALSTVSGRNGEFSLQRAESGPLRLTFSRLGYLEREIAFEMGAETSVRLNVDLMEDPIPVDPINVTVDREPLIGNIDREALGATTVVSEFGAAQSVAEVLQWQVPGVQVATGPLGEVSVAIRGMASLTHTTQPLVILDGMPVDSASVSWVLRRIHPSQIARIQVLRDIASTSVYGMKGSGGVLLIDLKKR